MKESALEKKIGRSIRLALGALCLLLVSVSAFGKDKGSPDQTVDSGSFGVFMNGRRIATETFSIHQDASGSTIASEFKSETGTDKAVQTSELELSSNGELKKYEWKEISPGQSQAEVVPNENFLTERFTHGPQEKKREQPFLLPSSTSILDDYFFVQREVLAWKFLATSCKRENGELKCPLKQRTQFGALNPHARASMPVSVEFAGREKVSIRGADREFNRLDLKSDTGDWTLWLDDQFMLQRILIPVDNTEVVRD